MTDQKKLDILQSNLQEFNLRCKISREQRSLTLIEIARTLCDLYEGEELSRIVARYSEISSDASPSDRLILCRELLSRKRSSHELKRLTVIGDHEETPAGSHGKIAYTKNNFNDVAFEQLSSSINSPRAIYTASINGACEAVADGSCEFCILPIENSVDGKLFNFYSFLDRFELKICAVCDIESDGDSNVRYALVGRSSLEPSGRFIKSTRYILEFFILGFGGETLDGIFEAARECGVELLSIDARPVPYDAQSKKFIMSFSVSSGDAMLFCSFLSLYYDSYSPIGLYPHL